MLILLPSHIVGWAISSITECRYVVPLKLSEYNLYVGLPCLIFGMKRKLIISGIPRVKGLIRVKWFAISARRWVWEGLKGMVGGLCTSNLPYFLHLSRTELIKLQFASGFFNFSPYYLTVKIYISCFLSVHRRNNVFLFYKHDEQSKYWSITVTINCYVQLGLL